MNGITVGIVLAYIGVIVGLIAGWILNLITVIDLAKAGDVTVELVIRAVCAVFLLPGGIAGWF